MSSAIVIDCSTDKVKIMAGDKRWMDNLDCLPLTKRWRLLLSSTPSPSSPDHWKPPIDMAVKRVSLGALQEWPGLPRGVKFDPSDGDYFGIFVQKLTKTTGYHETRGNENRAHAGWRKLDSMIIVSTEDLKKRNIRTQVFADVQQSVEGFLAGGKLHQKRSTCVVEARGTISCIYDDAQSNAKNLKNNLKVILP